MVTVEILQVVVYINGEDNKWLKLKTKRYDINRESNDNKRE